MAHFVIKTESFEGPFDTLLSLIEKKKLHISEVSLSSIAQDYVDFVSQNEFRLKDASSFIVTAATLMLIKSRSLLPTFNLTDDEQTEVEELQERLRLFSIFKNIMPIFSADFGRRRLYPRIYRVPKKEIVFRPDENVSLKGLRGAIGEVLTQIPEDVFLPEKKVEKHLTLKEVTEQISTRIKRFVRANFSELVVGSDKKGKAVSFLAVLELFKQGYVNLTQEEVFGSITVENLEERRQEQ